MPSTERIEQLHQQLSYLGDEPAVAAQRGEIVEPPPRPDSTIDDDLSALLDEAEEDSESLSDTAALLSNLDSVFDEEETPEEEEAPSSEEDDPFAGLDLGGDDIPFPSDFSSEETPDEWGDSGTAEDELAGEPSESGTDEEAPAEEPESGVPETEEPESDDFAFDDFDNLDDLDDLADLGDFPETEDWAAESTAEPEGPSEPSAGDEEGEDEEGEDEEAFLPPDFDDIGDEDFGEPEPETDEDSEGVPEAADDFEAAEELPDLDNLDGSEEFGRLDEVDEFSDQTPEEGEYEEAEDFSEVEELAEEDFARAVDAGYTGEIEEEEEPEEPEETEDDIFGADFGEKVDADFGDIDIDDVAGGEDALAGLDDSFEIPEVDEDLESLDEEGFSLGDFGEEFEITDESIDDFAGLEVDTAGLDEGGEEVEEATAVPEEAGVPRERELSDTEFTHIQQTLGTLPLNVKIAAEEAVGHGKGSPEEIDALIDLLIAGAAPQAVADQLSKMLDTRITVPKGYQKRTGLAFEEERRTFAFRLRHVILPALRTIAIVTVIAAVVGFLAYRFIYQPVHAAILYRQGYEQAENDRYEEANDTFRRAYDLRRRDEWFLRYARLYERKYQYQLAVEKYDQLVFGMAPERRERLIEIVRNGDLGVSRAIDDRNRRLQFFDVLNVHKPAILDHAALQSEVLANYRRADELYSILLFADEYDYEALLGRGDNYMRWAEENGEYYERARLAYATLLNRHGDTDEVLMRFLRYFIRTDNERQVEQLVNVFEEVSPEAAIDPQIYAEAAGYLLDRGRIAGIRDMLFRAYDEDPLVPEIHYELARYNRRTTSPQEEKTALDNAVAAFSEAEPLSQRRLRKQIDTYIMRGEYWYRMEEILNAQEDFDEALRRYEGAKEAAFLSEDGELARVYSRLGDIYYYHGRDYERALSRYNDAVADGYVTDEVQYKRGYVHYRDENYERATELFFSIGSISEIFSYNNNVIYARANALYQRGNYIAAEALYAELMDRLNQQRARINTLLVEEDTSHRALIENMVRVSNNLGIAQYRMGETTSVGPDGNPYLSEALTNLQRSTELSGNYLRDSETGERALATDLAFLNIREILYPEEEGFQPQIYVEIPRDPEQDLW